MWKNAYCTLHSFLIQMVKKKKIKIGANGWMNELLWKWLDKLLVLHMWVEWFVARICWLDE